MPTAVRLAAPPDVAAPDPTLDAALGRLRHRFGPAVAGRPEGAAPVAAVSTGSLALDLALGAGGVPRGRLTEVYGRDGAGKTNLALSVIAPAQQAGGTAASSTPNTPLTSPGRAGSAWMSSGWCRAGPSTASKPWRWPTCWSAPGAGRAGDRLHRRPGPQGRTGRGDGRAPPRRPGQPAQPGAPQAVWPDPRDGVAVVVTNQLRQRSGTPGTPVYTLGGRALGYYASLRLELRPLGQLRDGGRVVGSRVRVQVPKNKVASACGPRHRSHMP
jgi:recombination protein RecA